MKLSSIKILKVPVKLIGVLATTATVFALAPAAAQACNYSGAKQVFAPWGDRHHYVLGPDGGFEAGASGWSLSGGAATVTGNESYYLNAAADSRSLALPAGSSAGSPPVCMSLDTPIFRMFARNTGDPSSRLRVEAVYKLLGLVRTKAVSTVTAGPNWAPTQQMSTVLSLATIVGTLIPSNIQIRITPLDSKGQWQVDDLYIDPYARR
ncbi:MAG TPA: hypothetical protein VEQ41_08755 [Solirubrobacterales bacterium]|nr:hypothetical protein [Solirubrobacterales bacterium]